MTFMELAKRRFSVRNFSPAQVEEAKLQQILQAGRIAPTAANRQPQRILVVQSPAGLEKIGPAARIYGAPLVLIVCADRGAVWKRSYDGKDTLDIDASIVTDHMMLQATELGLGSLWICHFQPEALRRAFNLPEQLVPVNVLAIGYNAGPEASLDRHDQARLPLDRTVSYETF